MESRAREVKARVNPAIRMRFIPGHFATNHSHINYFIDLTQVKTGHHDAMLVADVLADHYQAKSVDTIVCMDETQMIAAFMASELSNSHNGINAEKNINVLIPEYNVNSQMIFRDNLQKMVWKKNVLLLIASATTGKTIKRSVECINYYGGKPVGVAAVFSAIESVSGVEVFSIFKGDDVPGYQTYSYKDCPFCTAQKKIDAIVNSNGYMKI